MPEEKERPVKIQRLIRRAPIPSRPTRRPGLVKLHGEWLQPREAAFLTEYLKHYNGLRAVKATHPSINGGAGPAAHALLKNPIVRAALRNALEKRSDRVEVTVDQVARYWHEIATADARELSQHIYVPCRFCYGVDHQYQFTDGELRSAAQEHLSAQMHKPKEGDRIPFDELGGGGYTRNRYPMRGPDWISKMERMYSEMARPIPEGVDANSDHSCPECHGDGERHVWVADTRHLSPGAARLYNGIRLTRDTIEIKQVDRLAAMEKFEMLVGMIRPRRAKFEFNLEELDTAQLDALLDEARSRGLLSDAEITQGRLIDATPVYSPERAEEVEEE